MSKVVISEFIDERALPALRAAHDVLYDPKLVDDAPRLKAEAASADALIVRNRTQVRGELLAALVRCKVIGRLGVGLDNIDVAACAARGMQVIPATGANALSVAEYVVCAAMLLLRGAYQSTAAVAAGQWPRAALSEGRETSGKTLGLVGFGSIGQLTAKLAIAMGMDVIAYDAMLDPAHPVYAASGVRAVGLDALIATADVISLHVPLVESTRKLFDARRVGQMKRGAVLINTARGGIVDEAALADAVREGRIAGAALDVFLAEPTTESPLFELDSVIVTPHLGASTAEAQDKAGQTIAEQVVLALRGEFVPFAVNLAASEASATVQPFMPLAERLGRMFTSIAGGVVDTLEVAYEGQIADYDCRVLTLSVLKGVLGPVVDEPVSFVNAPQMAEERGLNVRETTSSSATDFVNLIELRGTIQGRTFQVAGTLYGKQNAPRIVSIDDYIVDLAPSSHMLVVRNVDQPGMVGRVGTIVGNHQLNIEELDLGKGPTDTSLILLSTTQPVPADVVAELRATDGIVDAQAIELD
jgi:D-3-phosphoglycerate dehydrogenase